MTQPDEDGQGSDEAMTKVIKVNRICFARADCAMLEVSFVAWLFVRTRFACEKCIPKTLYALLRDEVLAC